MRGIFNTYCVSGTLHCALIRNSEVDDLQILMGDVALVIAQLRFTARVRLCVFNSERFKEF